MKNLILFLELKKELFLVFILSCVLCLPNFIDICSGYLRYQNLDIEQFLLWNYASATNVIPYKDIFYPYGILSYFKNYNPSSSFIYFLISPILLTLIFFFFKKIFKDKFIFFFSFSSFYLFILTLIGFQTFSRYGLLVCIAFLFTYNLINPKRLKVNKLFFFGIILGLVLSLISDIGVYLICSFTFLFFLIKIFQTEWDNTNLIKEILIILLGFILGLVPVGLFFFFHGNILALLNYLVDVNSITIVAKTPFFSFIDSPANIFTLSILYFAIFFILIKFLYFREKLTLLSLFQIALVFIILLMEQKSIIRSIDRQITFISLMLLMFVFYEVLNTIKIKINRIRILYFIIILITVFLYSLNVDKESVNLSNIYKNIDSTVSNKCYDNNFKFFLKKQPAYTKIIDFLKKQYDFNEKIFSFPTGDSTFYILLSQNPPYYNAIFEGASYHNQANTIKYIQSNKIKYVVLNTSKSSIQDGVPDFIRQSYLFEYILNNYYPIAFIGNHLILKEEKNKDFFASDVLKRAQEYRDYLLSVNLYKIPYSEGYYKYADLEKNNNVLIDDYDVKKINFLLRNTNLFSNNKVIVIMPSIDYKSTDLNYLKAKNENGEHTTIFFNACKMNAPCVLHLSRLPLFYKHGMLKEIEMNKGFSGRIKIFELKNQGDLW